MVTSPLKETKDKVLSPEDVVSMRHYFMAVYGWISQKDWEDIPLDILFDLWTKVQEEYNKKETLRICSLKFYGVKNPK